MVYFPESIPLSSSLNSSSASATCATPLFLIVMHFCRVIGEEDDEQRISDCSLEADFALFGKVSWRKDKILQGSFQALITKGATLQDFCLEDNQQAQYYRFDLDPGAGPLVCGASAAYLLHPRRPSSVGTSVRPERILPHLLRGVYLPQSLLPQMWLTWVRSVSKESITAFCF